MIIEAIITILLFIPNLLFSLLPTIELDIPENVLTGISEVFSTISYFFPVVPLLPILLMNLSLDLFRIIVAIVIRIKSFIPTMGG